MAKKRYTPEEIIAKLRQDFGATFIFDAFETDWLVGAAGFEPLHIRIGICQDSQPGGRDSNLRISN